MATIVKTPSATWKAVIRKSGWQAAPGRRYPHQEAQHPEKRTPQG
ncbi:hypothetical protein [Halomonas sp. XH26]|nr:hypothetical protein [Halomonas sp. XH26]